MEWIISRLNRVRQPLQSQRLPGSYPTQQSQAPWYTLAADAFNYLLILPLSVLMKALLLVFSLLFKTIYLLDRPREHSNYGTDITASSALVNDPIRRAEQFVLELEECLLPSQQYQLSNSDSSAQLLPPFFRGSYSQALYMANRRAQFFFVYLTNPHTEGSKSLFEKVIVNQKFIGLFSNADKTIIWGGNVAQAEAYQLATNLNITKFPMLGLLCLARTTTMTPEGPQKQAARISLILKIQGGIKDTVDVDALIHNKFINKMMRYEPELALIRAELREKFEQEALQRTQQEHFQRSLEQDRLKKLQKKKEENFVKFLKWRQPYILQLVFGDTSEPTLRVAFKFENGYRVTINFPQDSNIEDLFTYVELYNRDMLSTQYEVMLTDEEALKTFSKWPREYKSHLTSTVPPRPSLNDLPLTTKVGEVNFITPSGLLMVENIT